MHEVLHALAADECPVTIAMWDSFWRLLREDESRRATHAHALLRALAVRPPDERSVCSLVDSLSARARSVPAMDAVNIVGTGGGQATFNISTAAAIVAASIGVRVVKSGSRAYRSACGSIELLQLLRIPLAGSYDAIAETLARCGIAFAGTFVYPPELTLLAWGIAPLSMRELGGFFSHIGPFLAALRTSCQVTGVADHGLLPLLERLAAGHARQPVWLCSNPLGVDELVSFAENVIRVGGGTLVRVVPELLSPSPGSLADLRPAADAAAIVGQFTELLAGEGPPAAIESVCLNAASLVVASGLTTDWREARELTLRAIDDGQAAALLARLRRGPARATAVGRGLNRPLFDRPAHRPALVIFLNAGDPSFAVLRRIVLMLDECGVECVELAVPFPSSPTDGAAIRRSAARGMATGADLRSTLAFVAGIRGELRTLKIVLMADLRHTVRSVGIAGFLARARECGCGAVLLHGVPPRLRPQYYADAQALQLPLVATCFATSRAAVLREAAENASAFVYVAAHYGPEEGAGRPDPGRLAPVVRELRATARVPIAVGFGVRTAADIRAVGAAGADAAIVGGAAVACLERALSAGRDPVGALRSFVCDLRAGETATRVFDSTLALDHR